MEHQCVGGIIRTILLVLRILLWLAYTNFEDFYRKFNRNQSDILKFFETYLFFRTDWFKKELSDKQALFIIINLIFSLLDQTNTN